MHKTRPSLPGVADIRTAAGRLPSGSPPHKVYMRIVSLEAQRDRLRRDRALAEDRIRQCEQRCNAIQGEVNALLADVKRRFPDADLPNIVAGTSPGAQAEVHTRPSSYLHRY